LQIINPGWLANELIINSNSMKNNKLNNKKLLIIPAFALMAVLSAGTVSAHGNWGGMISNNIDPVKLAQNFDDKMQRQADLLGISIEEMKADWAAGKNISEIAKAKGITADQLKAKMQAWRDQELKQYLQTLVSQGKITQAQADARLKAVQDKSTQKKLNNRGKHLFFKKGVKATTPSPTTNN
jgi:hypothetical protein